VRTSLALLAIAASAAFVASRTERGKAIAVDAVGAVVNALTPRGIRNNNPGNIEWIADPSKRWRGMVAKDGRYGVFDTPANGVRAIGGELRANFRRGQNTLDAIIGEWAPAPENNTESYKRSVAAELGGVSTSTPLSSSTIPAITAAIIKHENGVQPYAVSDLALWVQA
jgi:hypothetical protein